MYSLFLYWKSIKSFFELLLLEFLIVDTGDYIKLLTLPTFLSFFWLSSGKLTKDVTCELYLLVMSSSGTAFSFFRMAFNYSFCTETGSISSVFYELCIV
jgi:hypothetical protein